MVRRFGVVLLVLGFVGVIGIRGASAQTDTFLFIEGIPGDSFDDKHRNWIDVLGLGQSLQPGLACDLTVTKRLDSAGPLLWAAAALGEVFAEMKIDVLRAGAPPRRLYELILATVQIKQVSTAGNAQGYMEVIALQTRSFTLTFFPVNDKGQPLPPVTRTVACSP